MKKIIRLAFIGVLAIAMVFAVVHMAIAQDQGTSDKPNSGKGDGHGKWGRFDGFKKRLGLTDDQEAKLKDLFKSRSDEIKPLRDQLEVDRDKLRLLVDKNASESDLTDSMDKISAERETLKTAQEKFRQKMKALLTPKQQAQMMFLRGHGRGGFGRHGWGGRWGWGKHGMDHAWGDHHKDKSKNSKKPETKDSNNSDQN